MKTEDVVAEKVRIKYNISLERYLKKQERRNSKLSDVSYDLQVSYKKIRICCNLFKITISKRKNDVYRLGKTNKKIQTMAEYAQKDLSKAAQLFIYGKLIEEISYDT